MARLNVSSVGGGGVGAGGTMLARQMLDAQGSTSLSRPSVMLGVGSGAAALAAWWFSSGEAMLPMWAEDGLYGYGLGALAAGSASAFVPKGNSPLNPRLPTLPSF